MSHAWFILMIGAMVVMVTDTIYVENNSGCLEGWDQFESTCYLFKHIDVSHTDAKEQCIILDSQQVVIHSQGEQNFLAEKINTDWEYYHIGLDDTAVEGTFQWVDGTPLNFTAWQHGEPNDYYLGEDCAGLWPSKGGNWNDYPCTTLGAYICEKPLGMLGSCEGNHSFSCNGTGLCINEAFRCDNETDCGTKDLSDETDCPKWLCGGNLTAWSGVIQSPGFPTSYPINARCTWIIHGSPGTFIHLRVTEFLIDSSCYDWIEVYGDKSVAAPGLNVFTVYCGEKYPFEITVDNYLWLQFRSDSSSSSHSGFRAEYTIDINNCASNPCLNEGTCHDVGHGYLCSCFGEFSGVNCEVNRYSCEFVSCENNSQCEMRTEIGAATRIRRCTSVAFMNHVCEDMTSHLECSHGQTIVINSALYGRRNEHDECDTNSHVNDCEASGSFEIVRDMCDGKPKCDIMATNGVFNDPCVGIVKYLQIEYSCEHSDEIDNCASNPCMDRGSCQDVGRGFVCLCYGRFDGVTCEIERDSCENEVVACEENALCVNMMDEVHRDGIMPRCECKDGFESINGSCHSDPCFSNPCKNQGTCRVTDYHSGGWICDCPDKYRGQSCDMCQMDHFQCHNLTCIPQQRICDGKNDCADASDEFGCPDSCVPTPCRNGGHCEVFDGSSTICKCVGGWKGVLCDTPSHVLVISSSLVLDGTFDPALAHYSSNEFISMADGFETIVNTLLANAFGASFDECRVTNFRNGSIKVEFDILFNFVPNDFVKPYDMDTISQILRSLIENAVKNGSLGDLPVQTNSLQVAMVSLNEIDQSTETRRGHFEGALGGTVGGLVLICLLIILVYLIRRRKKNAEGSSDNKHGQSGTETNNSQRMNQTYQITDPEDGYHEVNDQLQDYAFVDSSRSITGNNHDDDTYAYAETTPDMRPSAAISMLDQESQEGWNDNTIYSASGECDESSSRAVENRNTQEGWMDNSVYATSKVDENDQEGWMDNSIYSGN